MSALSNDHLGQREWLPATRKGMHSPIGAFCRLQRPINFVQQERFTSWALILIVAFENGFHDAIGVATGTLSIVTGLLATAWVAAIGLVVVDLAAASIVLAGFDRNGAHVDFPLVNKSAKF